MVVRGGAERRSKNTCKSISVVGHCLLGAARLRGSLVAGLGARSRTASQEGSIQEQPTGRRRARWSSGPALAGVCLTAEPRVRLEWEERGLAWA
jgi:hypothetical protein